MFPIVDSDLFGRTGELSLVPSNPALAPVLDGARLQRLLGGAYWRMSANSILQRALTNARLHEQGVPDMRTLWITLHYGQAARV